MKRWDRVRGAALLAALAVILGVLGKVILAPGLPLESSLPPLVFPTATPLRGWEADVPEGPSEALYRSGTEGVSLEIRMRFIADVRALYGSDPGLVMRMLPPGFLPLDAGMHYMVDAAGWIQANDNGAPPALRRLEITEGAGSGVHGFWDDGSRLHLSALIGSDGHTAATTRELICNIYLRQFGVARIARWLLGEAPLPDKRCILADVSILAPDIPREEARRRLEEAWSEWYGWCAPNFTKACATTD